MILEDARLSVIIPIGSKRKMEAISYLKKQTTPIAIIVEKGDNPSANRNKGVKKARGEFIAFIDSHSILPNDWAEKIISFFDRYKEIDIIGGPQLTPPDSSAFARASGYCLASIFSTANTSKRYKIDKLNLNATERHLTSANLACRRKVVEKIRFDESLWPGEDPKFILDAKKMGFKAAYDPRVYLFHKRRGTFKDLADQIRHYGIMRSRHLKKSLIKNPLFLIPSLFLIYLFLIPILYILFIPLPFSARLVLLAPLALYVALNFFFSLYESIKNKNLQSIILIPFIFLIIHISYGSGFLYGLIVKFSK